MSEAAAEKPAESAAPKKSPLSLELILVGVNTLAVLGLLGFAAYAKLIYKRPAIREAEERARLEKIKASPKPLPVSALIAFEPMTSNIASTPTETGRLKGHHISFTFSIEVKDKEREDVILGAKPLLIDRFLKILSDKQPDELTNVQGRYKLKAQMVDSANQIITEAEPEVQNLVTNIFFSQYLVQ